MIYELAYLNIICYNHHLTYNLEENSSSKKVLDDFLVKLKGHLESPLLTERIQNPVLAPSDVTIDKSVVLKLPGDGEPDIVSESEISQDLVPKLLIKDIVDFYNKCIT